MVGANALTGILDNDELVHRIVGNLIRLASVCPPSPSADALMKLLTHSVESREGFCLKETRALG
jgi:hypothetical protein